MAKRWCSVCYRNNKDQNGIINDDEIETHYRINHGLPNRKKTDLRNAYPVKYNKYNEPYLYDDVSTKLPPLTVTDAAVFLKHKKTEHDIISRIERGINYVISWHNKPYRSAYLDYQWTIKAYCAESDDDGAGGMHAEPISASIKMYPDLKKKLEKEYPQILDDIYNRSPSNLDTMSFKTRSLQIIKELKDFISWIKPFLKPVDKNQYPDYYKMIKDPMDLETLQQQIYDGIIKTDKQFCTKLTLIWKNAQKYNPPENKVYQLSTKCQKESKRLIEKYFPKLGIPNSPNRHKLAIVKYIDNVRQSLICSLCQNEMKLLSGFHDDCADSWDGQKHCTSCQCILKDLSVAYYHCIDCCTSSNKNKTFHNPCIFLCEICAARNYDSKQIPNGCLVKNSPFYGIWINIEQDWYEAVIIQQDANRIFCQMIFSSENESYNSDKTQFTATITDFNDDKLVFELDSIDIDRHKINKGEVNVEKMELRFIDSSESEMDNIYRKIKQKCKNCNVDMILMLKDTSPDSRYFSTRTCDVHQQFYESERKSDKSQRCRSFYAFKYDKVDTKEIHKKAFYYTCPSCNNFDICGGCLLIKQELEFENDYNNNYENTENMAPSNRNKRKLNSIDGNNYSQPPAKRQKISSSGSVRGELQSCDDDDSSINCDNLPLLRKQRINIESKMERMNINEDNVNYKELYLKEKEENKKLLSELENCKQERDKWQGKFISLYRKMKNLLLTDKNSDGPPIQ